ncbi:MAG: hypothetical protein QOK41_1138, partial [Sphingomonadales bacterium]|nr:hypothetical protein [Sphingomonadales bacterium]
MTARLLCLSVMAAAIAMALGADAASPPDANVELSPKALQEIAQVEAEIDRIEAQTAERLAKPPDNQVQQVELLGKLILFDKQLSV